MKRRRRRIIPYKKHLVPFARKLRNHSTLGEVLLWLRIKGKQMRGYDFHRQKPLDRYIVDFFCHELMLAIEIDGASHNSDERRKKDALRQKRLELLGIRFLRFTEGEVRQELDRVVAEIEQWIDENGEP